MSKQIKSKALASSLLCALLVSVAGSASAVGIKQSKHDLSITGQNTAASGLRSSDQNEICVFCHTPHNAIKNTHIPLWNHNLSAVATYTLYTSDTLNATMGQMGGATEAGATVTNLCLSCHDGTVALNSLNRPSKERSTTTFSGTGLMTGTANLGTDLSKSHPVNFNYTASDPFTTGSGGGLVSGAGSAKLFANTVQCASCHDVHTSAEVDGSNRPIAFLRVSMSGSTLCFQCHDK